MDFPRRDGKIPDCLERVNSLPSNKFLDWSKLKAFAENNLNVKIMISGFNPFPNKPWFSHVCSTNLLKTMWEKEKLLLKSNFSFSHSVFYSFGELSAIFIKFEIVVCKVFQFEQV